MGELLAYLTLFVIAFGAATLLPLQSEAVLVGTARFGAPLEHFWCTSSALTPVHRNFYRTEACALLRLP